MNLKFLTDQQMHALFSFMRWTMCSLMVLVSVDLVLPTQYIVAQHTMIECDMEEGESSSKEVEKEKEDSKLMTVHGEMTSSGFALLPFRFEECHAVHEDFIHDPLDPPPEFMMV